MINGVHYMPSKNTKRPVSTARHTTIRLAPDIYKVISESVLKLKDQTNNRSWCQSAIVNLAVLHFMKFLDGVTDGELIELFMQYQELTHSTRTKRGRRNGKMFADYN